MRLNFKETLSLTYKLFTKCLKEIFIINILYSLILTFFTQSLFLKVDSEKMFQCMSNINIKVLEKYACSIPLHNILVVTIVLAIFYLSKYILYSQLSENIRQNQKIGWAELTKKTGAKFFPVFLTVLLFCVMAIPLYILFIIPGLMFSVAGLFTLPVVSLRDKIGWSAIKQSFVLTKSYRMRIFGYYILMNFILMLASKIALIIKYIFKNVMLVDFAEFLTNFIISDILIFFVLSLMFILETKDTDNV